MIINPRDCERFREELASWLEGDISREAAEHLAVCDACRDLRHDARVIADAIVQSGADYEPPADLSERRAHP